MGDCVRDEYFMRRALNLARRGLGRTRPNPVVGSIVVVGDTVVGNGYHRAAGTEHAEVLALQVAGEAARGAELFVNLEPCCHQGRTGPCTTAIINAGVRRVIIGMVDPNPLVNGVGIQQLRAAGIDVTVGVLQDACEDINSPFVCATVHGRPLVTFKTAVTLDGRVATRAGQSRWITGPQARAFAHQLRNTHDAVVVGIGTVLCDDPQLDCREVRGGRDPLRIIVDSQLRTPPDARVVELCGRSSAPTLIVTTSQADEARATALERAGVTLIPVASTEGRVKIGAMLSELAHRGILSLLLEGGPTLAGSFWKGRLVDRVVSIMAPTILGDSEALPMIDGGAVLQLDGAAQLDSYSARRLGQDMMLMGSVKWPQTRSQGR